MLKFGHLQKTSTRRRMTERKPQTRSLRPDKQSRNTDSMAGEDRVTLLRPPPKDDTKAPIENALEVTEMAVLGKVRTP